jgi:hypothetical protein
MTFKHMQNFPRGDSMNGIKSGIILILITGFACWVNADPVVILFEVIPKTDTMAAGDSFTVNGIVIDDMNQIHHEFDTCIHWRILPADSKSKLSATTGSQVTYYAVDAYRINQIVATFTDPIYGSTLADTVTIYIKPGEATQLLVEPYPVVSQYIPDPVDSVVLLATETHKEIAAVIRDRFGNFSRFDSSVTWESGDSGIVQVRTPDKPYVCRIERVEKGNSATTFVLCKKGGLTIGTAKVVVRSGIIYVRCLEGLPTFSTPRAVKKEFYNLRGQKLPLYGIRHADGIVLERIIEPDGKTNFRKIIPAIKSR